MAVGGYPTLHSVLRALDGTEMPPGPSENHNPQTSNESLLARQRTVERDRLSIGRECAHRAEEMRRHIMMSALNTLRMPYQIKRPIMND